MLNARWSPKYDIRVFSEEKQIKIMYYGVIRQGTGEDWNDVKVSLSSAMPSVAGTVPPLGTQKLRLKRQEVYTERKYKSALPTFGFMKKKQLQTTVQTAEYDCDEPDDDDSDRMEMGLEQAEVREGISSAVFEIQRTSTIPSDNTEHKVTVAVIDLQPQFHYECIPKKSTFAYLKAKVTNSSQYAMLAGPTNIFLDNNFIAKGSLKAVSPGEEFECSCGIDPAIRISYKPVEKHRNKTGWMSKSNVTTFKQVIEVKNTHQTPAQIRLTEHYPQSTEGAIKVHLVDPASAAQKHENKGETDPGVFINKHHNIEWNFELAAGVSRDLVLRYTIELATSEELDFFEEFSPDD